MIIREPRSHFIIAKKPLQDMQLSWEAKGIWAYLMSLENGSDRISFHDSDTIKAMAQLVHRGYATIHVQEDGTSTYAIYEEKQK